MHFYLLPFDVCNCEQTHPTVSLRDDSWNGNGGCVRGYRTVMSVPVMSPFMDLHIQRLPLPWYVEERYLQWSGCSHQLQRETGGGDVYWRKTAGMNWCLYGGNVYRRTTGYCMVCLGEMTDIVCTYIRRYRKEGCWTCSSSSKLSFLHAPLEAIL